jgi:integrase/recombinase XerD
MVILARLATEFLERHGLAATTLRSYEFTLMPLLKEYGRWSIDILDRQLLVEYLNQITDVSYITHHRHQAVITALFNFAVQQDYIKSNPISNLKRRKPNREDGEHATDENVRYLRSCTILKGVAKRAKV